MKAKPFNNLKNKIKRSRKNAKKLNRRNLSIFLIVYLLLVGLSIFLISQPSHYLGKWYVDNQNGFAIRPPKGWDNKPNYDNATVEFDDNKDSSKAIKVDVSQTSATLSDFVTQLKSAIPQTLPSFSLIKEFNTTIGGQPAHVIDGEAKINLVWKEDRIVIVIYKGNVYVVTANTNLSDWSTSEFILFSSLKTFQTF